MNLENTIHEMLTTSTGTHFLDSGGASGRHWQQNEKKTIEDFQNEAPAILSLEYSYPEITVSVFHALTDGRIELDEICENFNDQACDNWSGTYYGTSREQSFWLDEVGFRPFQKCDGWNTYNWENNFSQVLQGHHLKFEDEHYALIQIHQGADVRGGYTDAKLFKLNDYAEPWNVYRDDCIFPVDDGEKEFLLFCFGSIIQNEDCRTIDDDEILELKEISQNGQIPGILISDI
tara:strand:- start:339 stop:1037 length:699 start_codon:yes stop_codon:yes gene_type:complete